ncbi:MAG: gliding motility protein GldC [Flavobacteriales bacterium]|jgi:gliding motility-associated protein GldC|nr:gliding motility protein GldC [Flavobacteriales bacterium]
MSKKTSEINLTVELDVNNVPEKIVWSASDASEEVKQAKAFLLSVWDEKEKNTLRMDLWTKEMSVEEMNKFFFQTYITMADTFQRATSEDGIGEAMRDFAEFFGEKMGVIKSTGKFDAP